MGKRLSITIHPSPVAGEYLTVSDAMRQVLDMIEAMENLDKPQEKGARIVWRLTEAHTNSPPFTVVAEAFPSDPAVSVAYEADRVTRTFTAGLQQLLEGRHPDYFGDEIEIQIRKVLKRNLNGIGRTEISWDDEAVTISPANAKIALGIIEFDILTADLMAEDLGRVEYGSIVGDVIGLGRYYDAPTLIVRDRLSRVRVPCVLTPDLVAAVGPAHAWSEAWEGRRLLISGALRYGSDGKLKRVDAAGVEELPWTAPDLSEARKVDVLEGRTVRDHLDEFWGDGVDQA